MNVYDLNANFFRMINNLRKRFTFMNPIMIFIAEYFVYLLALYVMFALHSCTSEKA
jgi:undecaprenyl-diphosphatase